MGHVIAVVKNALRFMESRERMVFYGFLFSRASIAIFDLAGIISFGYLAASVASYATPSEPVNQIKIGSFQLPPVPIHDMPLFAVLILLLFIAKALSAILLTFFMARFLARIEARAARVIAKTAFGKGLETARLNSREEIIYIVQAGSPSTFNTIPNALGSVIAEGSLFLLVLLTFAVVDPVVALAAVCFFGVIAILIQFVIGSRIEKISKLVAEFSIEANTGLSDLGEVFREVSMVGRQNFFYDKIYKSRLNTASNGAKHVVLSSMPRYIIETSLLMAIAIFVLSQVIGGNFLSSISTLGIFLSGGLRLTASLLPMQAALLSIKQSIPYAKLTFGLLSDSEKEVKVERNDNKERTPSTVHLHKVNFCFPNSSKTILRDISLTIHPGTQVAFIGSSGSGKSTLADLILGLLEPSSGVIKINDTDSASLIRSAPGLTAYVPQKPGMISGSILENITLGVPADEINETALEAAVNDSNLTEFINSLPEGIHTDLGKRKDQLSGGQIQRIGLARALYSKPSLLIMDEATSALDAESEDEINKALDRMRGKVTVILIAHRLNTIQRSDAVYLIDNGEISASGKFSDLMNGNERVRKLVALMAVEPVD